ncbi:WbqC family protein [Roseobacter sp. S98]|uniref:WbqC family protein n=1 Tax=Roseobacter algicola (ex Choi et al. 2025) (nom. illeg.) TaxID=3092138 RepID=UPI0035C73EC5
MKRVAIVQSNYIPWRGYFDMIAAADEFILYDDMQYTRRDWRNRNKIKTSQGTIWLTVPVSVKGKYHQKIFETQIHDQSWRAEHWRSISLNYRRAPYFDEVAAWMKPLFLSATQNNLSETNRVFIEAICEKMGIGTVISSSRDYVLSEGKTERLADLCFQAGGTEYISGPSAKDYVDEAVFKAKDIHLRWFDYNGYKPYRQLWGEFEPGVSVVDLLFNCGPEARNFLRY